MLSPGVLRIERCLDPRLRHGRFRLSASDEPRFLPLPADCASGDPPSTWLCLDTETSGLAGGTGTWAFLTGVLRQTWQGWVLRQILLTRLDAEPAYLEAVGAELARPARLLTYNGKAFDAPLLATRFRLAGLPDPLVGLPHLDLLAPVRRVFGRCWPDCRLATAESRLLGLDRQDDLPGAASPLAWLGWLRRGETSPLARVLRHNRLDLCSLAGLLPRMDAVYADPATHGAEVRAVAAHHRERGRLDLALEILAGHRRSLEPTGLLDLAALYRRAGRWAESVAIWESLEAAGNLQARVALAGYHEHRSRDLECALTLTEALPFGEDRERRRARLLVKRARHVSRP
ncbi:MAG: ribonuclease H-like domain-containing protein [Bdellovibrio bacteriovorus]